jgi:hypothetical protein
MDADVDKISYFNVEEFIGSDDLNGSSIDHW